MVILSNIILFVFAGTTCLSAFYVRCEDETENMSSNCYIRDFSKIRCTGNFNLSNILSEQRKLIEPDADTWSHRKFRGLEIFDSDIEEINEKVAQFHGFIFETILIENAPNLKSITPNALVELRDDLTDFRAINTGLPQYNDFGNGPQEKENPFDDFKELREVYIGKQTRCPSDQTLLFPCTCEFGELSRTVPLGLYGWSHGISNIFGTTAQVTCDNENLTGDQLKKAFENLSRSDHEPKHFDVLTIRGATSLTDIPSNVFSNISITTIWMEDVTNLRSIHSKAFVSETSDYGARSIQVLDISTANFTMANADEVDDLFDALSSLTNIRVLRFSKCGIPFIPPHAFTPEHHSKQLNNLRYLSLSLDRKHHKSGIRSIGSYAFSAAPKLVELAVERNFIEEFDAFAFAFNQTSNKQLTIHIGGNPFNDTVGLKANAFSGIRRPTRIIFEVSSFDASDEANDPSLNYMPENVFRPFIEENAENYFEVNYYNVDIWCDCGSKWMFDEVGNLRPEVQNGLRIKRITDNVIASDPLSIQCKANSSFDCLPNCLTFPSAGLIHCGGNGDFDIKSTFLKLGQSIEQKKLSKLMFSSKGIRELPMESFGSFQFEIVDFADCTNLSSIHSNAFGASTNSIRSFSAKNTNLTYYPNFSLFPSLEIIKLDDFHKFHLNSSNFDYSEPDKHPKEIIVFLNDGTIEPKTFTKLNNETTVNLQIGERNDCSTLGCLLKCKPVAFPLDEEMVTTFLEANPKNRIQTNCYLTCSCDIKWLYEHWNNTVSRVGVWIDEYFGDAFYCVPKEANLKTESSFFGIDVSQFNHGSYFKDNC